MKNKNKINHTLSYFIVHACLDMTFSTVSIFILMLCFTLKATKTNNNKKKKKKKTYKAPQQIAKKKKKRPKTSLGTFCSLLFVYLSCE